MKFCWVITQIFDFLLGHDSNVDFFCWAVAHFLEIEKCDLAPYHVLKVCRPLLFRALFSKEDRLP